MIKISWREALQIMQFAIEENINLKINSHLITGNSAVGCLVYIVFPK